MTDPLVSCREVSRSYGSLRAVRDFSTTVSSNEVVVLVGPNGCCKTTAVGMMLGLRKRDEGSIHLLGCDPRSERKKLSGRVRAALQDASMHRQIKIREQLEYLAAVYGTSDTDISSIADDLGIADLLSKRFGRLSGGQQKRAMMAGTLLGAPKFVVLDEPTSGVDIESRSALWSTIRRRIFSSKTGILVTSHDLHEAESYADRVIIMREGFILADNSPNAIIGSVGLERVMVVRSDFGAQIDDDDYASSQVLSYFPGALTLGYAENEPLRGDARGLSQKYGDRSVLVRPVKLSDAYLKLGSLFEADNVKGRMK